MAGSVTEQQHTIALKWFATCFTGDMVDSLFLDSFRMLRPPLHTAPVRTEPLFLRARRVMKGLAAIAASLA